MSADSMAPLGTPVVPEVHMISAGLPAGGFTYVPPSSAFTCSRPALSVIIYGGFSISKIRLQWISPYRNDSGTAGTPAAKQLSSARAADSSDRHRIAQHGPFSCAANVSAKSAAS